MSEPKVGLRTIVLACIVLCIVATLQGAHAADDKNSGLKVASVDIAKLNSDYVAFNKNSKVLSDKLQANLTVLRTMQQHMLLPEADHKALADLLVAEATQQGGLNAGQKDQKQKLLDKSKALAAEFIELQQKKVADLQAQDKDKLNAFFRSQTEGEARIQKLQQEMGEALQSEDAKNKTTALKGVRDAITKVAKEKGISVVFSNDVAWYADNDITDAVLKDLNK